MKLTTSKAIIKYPPNHINQQIIIISIDKDFHKRIKIFSAEQEMTIKDMFIECMEKRMAEAKKKEKKEK